MNEIITGFNTACQQGRTPFIRWIDGQFKLVIAKGTKRCREEDLQSLCSFLGTYEKYLCPKKNREQALFLSHLEGRVKRIKTEASNLESRLQDVLKGALPPVPTRNLVPESELPYARSLAAYCDVHLEVGEEKIIFPCHRLTLAKSSPYFDQLFQGAFRERNQNTVRLPDINPHDFSLFLNYCYAKKLPEDPSDLVHLALLADFVRCDRLLAKVAEKLQAIGDTLDFSSRLQIIESLVPAWTGSFKRTFEPILFTMLAHEKLELSQMSRDVIQLIAAADKLPISEKELLELLLKWEAPQLQPGQVPGTLLFEKRDGNPSLAEHVRFEWMSSKAFLEMVEDSPFLSPEKKWNFLQLIRTREELRERPVSLRPKRNGSCSWLESMEHDGDVAVATLKGCVHFTLPQETSDEPLLVLFGEVWEITPCYCDVKARSILLSGGLSLRKVTKTKYSEVKGVAEVTIQGLDKPRTDPPVKFRDCTGVSLTEAELEKALINGVLYYTIVIRADPKKDFTLRTSSD